MNETKIISERFSFKPNLNLLKDEETDIDIKLEPRLVNLLNLLFENSGKIVTREEIIDKIWNNYGGADDGLNQAISFLRKALLDGEKKIIETVPKKGYVLNILLPKVEKNQKTKSLFSKKKITIIFLTAFLIAVSGISFFILKKKNSLNKVETREEVDNPINIDYKQLNEPEPETFLNTITTVTPDSIRYKLIAIGDKRPTFYVNDKLVTDMDKHTDIIDNLLKQLWQRQKKYNDSIQNFSK